MIRATLRPPRFYLLGRRIHHGPIGVIIAIQGICIAVHDRRDWKQWIAR